MLVLRRAVDERTVIRTPEGREIVVTVIDTGSGRVRLGFTADRDVQIDRAELLTSRRPDPDRPRAA